MGRGAGKPNSKQLLPATNISTPPSSQTYVGFYTSRSGWEALLGKEGFTGFYRFFFGFSITFFFNLAHDSLYSLPSVDDVEISPLEYLPNLREGMLNLLASGQDGGSNVSLWNGEKGGGSFFF